VKSISDNWIIRNLENAIATWNDKLAELWQLITQTPESFKGGAIWGVIVNINSALIGIGYGLLVLFFAIGVFSSAASFRELQRPEFALRHFIRFVLAKVAVGRGMELMTAIFSICGSVVSASMSSIGGAVTESATLPSELVSAIESVGFLQSVPLWIVSVLGSLFITVMSFILILTVYGRFFKLYLYGESWAARSKRASMEYKYWPHARSRPWSSRTRWTNMGGLSSVLTVCRKRSVPLFL